MSHIQLLDDVEGLTWLVETYPFVQDGKPIAAAITGNRWIAVYEVNHYKCKPRLWCEEGHLNQPVQDESSWTPPKECEQCKHIETSAP
jgi:hypothetical protein